MPFPQATRLTKNARHIVEASLGSTALLSGSQNSLWVSSTLHERTAARSNQTVNQDGGFLNRFCQAVRMYDKRSHHDDHQKQEKLNCSPKGHREFAIDADHVAVAVGVGRGWMSD